jgi:hypothetical protein
MKKILLTFTVIAFIMFGSMSASVANPETFYVKITLTDNCSPGNYHGYYCVRVHLKYNGSTVCTATICTVIPGTNCYAFTCSFEPVAEEPYYGVEFVDAARYPSGNCSPGTGTNSSYIYTWAQMQDNTCSYASITVTL